MNNKRIKKIAACGIFGGLSLVLYLVEIFRFPMGWLFTSAPFLKLNLSDIPALIAGFAYGPIVGAIIVIIKNLAKLAFTHTGFVGELADFSVSIFFVLPATLIYRFKKDKVGALIGLGVGTLLSCIAGCLMNAFVLLPMYHWHGDYLKTIMFGVLPFNLLRCVLVSILVFFIYKRISKVISKYGAK